SVNLKRRQRKSGDISRQVPDNGTRPDIFQRDPLQLRVLLRGPSVKADLRGFGTIRPLDPPSIPGLVGRATSRRQPVDDRALQPELRRMVTPLAGIVRLQLMLVGEQLTVLA